jgi:hypothetical protein
MKTFALALVLSAHATAGAQVLENGQPLESPTTRAAIESLQAKIPRPAMEVGQAEMVGGKVGDQAMTYKRGDWVPDRISRTTTCVLVSGGTCNGDWEGGPFPAGTKLRLTGDPAAVNPTSRPIQCNATVLTVQKAYVRCWIALTGLLPVLGTPLDPFGAAATGTEIQVTAIPAS